MSDNENLDAQTVAHFLQNNPGFFTTYADLLGEIDVPNPHGGQAIPLSDRQVLGLRDKNRALEGKLGELIQFGEENDATSEGVHHLAVALLTAKSLDEALIEGGKTRLRPILMTASATILALIPLALSGEGGAIIASDLAVVVIGGLFT